MAVEARFCVGSGVRDGPAPLGLRELTLQESVGLADDRVGVLVGAESCERVG